jgi:hypothetical protein
VGCIIAFLTPLWVTVMLSFSRSLFSEELFIFPRQVFTSSVALFLLVGRPCYLLLHSHSLPLSTLLYMWGRCCMDSISRFPCCLSSKWVWPMGQLLQEIWRRKLRSEFTFLPSFLQDHLRLVVSLNQWSLLLSTCPTLCDSIFWSFGDCSLRVGNSAAFTSPGFAVSPGLLWFHSLILLEIVFFQ